MLVLKQFLRFAIVGALGVLIDYGLFNILTWIFDITKGNGLIPLNVISFGLAIIVTFLLNKYWTFRDLSRGDNIYKFNLFLFVSIIGLVINTAIVRIITDYPSTMFFNLIMTDRQWLNVAKGLATIASGLWNFTNYKLNVFKK